MALKNCVVCNSSFNARGNQRACNDCREKQRPYCIQCDKKRVSKPVNKFCSLECKNASLIVVERRPCATCGKDFKPKSSDPSRKFCSKNCFFDSIRIPNQQPCHHCGNFFKPNTLTRDQKYCSYDCTHLARRKRIKKTCQHCGKTFDCQVCREKTQHHCNRRCRAADIIGPNHPAWKGGTPNSYGPSWNQQAKKVRKRDGYRCQCCGISQKKLTRSLDVHHIRPFKEFGYIPGQNDNYKKANELSNLISLCGSCHRKAETGKIPIQPRLL
ncbi:MAG: HNH endonuclease [Ardenticatenaceae bacterium]